MKYEKMPSVSSAEFAHSVISANIDFDISVVVRLEEQPLRLARSPLNYEKLKYPLSRNNL